MPDPPTTAALKLPPAPSPQGRYATAVVHGGLAVSAGMTPRVDGKLLARGRVGLDIDVADAHELAGVAARNALSAVAEAAGGLDRVVRCLQLTVFIAASPEFAEHTSVADGASATLVAALGDRGQVARAAVGVTSLPSEAPIEVVLTAVVRPDDADLP